MLKKAGEKTIVEKEQLFVASQWQLIRWRFRRHKLAMVALIVLIAFYLSAIFAEFVAPYDPRRNNVSSLSAPPQLVRFVDESGRFHLRPFVYGMKSEFDLKTIRRTYQVDKTEEHPIYLFVHGDPYELWGLIPLNLHLFGVREGEMFLFGSDRQGRDMVSRIIHGGRISMSVGLVGVALSFILGIIIGGISGYYGGRVDTVIQRAIEIIRSIPTLPLWMALSVALPPFWSMIQVYFSIVVILSLVGWTDLARVVRGKFMSVREEDYVMAAAVSGAGRAQILFRHLLPSFYSYIIASLTLSIPWMILGETALSFIGLGLQAPAISWGVLLKGSQEISVLAKTPWLLIPSVFIIVAILAFNFVGDGLRDAADPYTAL